MLNCIGQTDRWFHVKCNEKGNAVSLRCRDGHLNSSCKQLFWAWKARKWRFIHIATAHGCNCYNPPHIFIAWETSVCDMCHSLRFTWSRNQDLLVLRWLPKYRDITVALSQSLYRCKDSCVGHCIIIIIIIIIISSSSSSSSSNSIQGKLWDLKYRKWHSRSSGVKVSNFTTANF